MKKLLIIIGILFLWAASFSQTVRTGVRQQNNSKGQTVKEWAIDSVLRFPKDTLRLLAKDSGSYADKDGVLYRFNGDTWDVASAAGGADTAILNNYYAKITDSSIILIDTSGLRYQSNILRNSKPYNVLRSFQSFRAISTIDSNTIWRTNINGLIRDYIYDPSDVSSADDSVTTILVGAKRFKLYFESYVLANWFGAIPDDGIDDSYAIQKAINFAIANLKTPVVRVLGGIYNVKNLVIYKWKPGNSEYAFVQCTIEGVSPTVGANVNQTTTFYNTDANSFIINIQAGRNCVLRNIAFQGVVTTPSNQKSLIERTDADWTSSGTFRSNRNSPSALIVVDAFHSTVGSGNRYPGMSAWYSNTEFEGTSHVLIDGCDLRNSLVGVLISPNEYTENGDNIRLQNSTVEYLKSAWAPCQTQTRGNSMDNVLGIGGIETFIDCVTYGDQQGTPPACDNLNLAGGIKYLHNYAGDFGGVAYTNSYMESIWSIGKSGGYAAVFDNTGLNFIVPDGTGVKPPPVLAEGKQVIFRKGSMAYFDGAYSAGFPFNVEQLSFDGTTIVGGVPFLTNLYRRDAVTFRDVKYLNIEAFSTLHQNNITSNVALATVNNYHMLPGTKYKTEYQGVIYEGVGDKFDRDILDTANVRINGATNLGYFISTYGAKWRAGDMITTYNQSVNYTNDIYTAADCTLGFVYDIVGDSVKIKYSPYGLVDNTSFVLYRTRIPRFYGRVFGNTTSGSKYITTVNHDVNATFLAGSTIKGAGIPIGARVDSIGATVIKISLAATASGTTVQLYDAKVKATVTNVAIDANNNSAVDYELPWFVGDEWINVRGGNPRSGYFIVPGYLNATAGRPAAVYGVLQTQDNSTIAGLSTYNVYTAKNLFKSPVYFGQDTTSYGATFLRIDRSANVFGVNNIQSYKNKNVYGDAQDLGDLNLNPLGGNVRIGTAPTTEQNTLDVYGRINSYGTNGGAFFAHQAGTSHVAFFGMENFGGSDGFIGRIYTYDGTNFRPFRIDSRIIDLRINGSTTGSMHLDSTGISQDGKITATGEIISGTTLRGINASLTGGITLENSDVTAWGIYQNGNGTTASKNLFRGKAWFVDTVRYNYLAVAHATDKVAVIDSLGRIKTAGTYISPDYNPLAISTGTGSTVTLTDGYVGTIVFFNPTLAIATYTLALPASPMDNQRVKILFGGIISTAGAAVVVSLTITHASTIIEKSAVTAGNAGDVLDYWYYNGHWYRETDK